MNKEYLRIRNVSEKTIRLINVYAAEKGITRAQALDELIEKAMAE